MTIKQKNEFGFSIIECLIVIIVISSVSIISFTSFKKVCEKANKATQLDDITKITYYYNYEISRITKAVYVWTDTNFYILVYPFIAMNPSKSNEMQKDDTDYEIICKYFLDNIFNKVEGFDGGTYEYEPVTFTMGGEKMKNVITYRCKKGVIELKAIVYNGNTLSRDELTFYEFVYTDNNGKSTTVKVYKYDYNK